MFMYRDRLEEFETSTPSSRDTGLNFLAHEDVALKAYFESRRRYLGGLPAQRAFNQIGEVLPTIVLNGQIVGTWAWDARQQSMKCSIARGYGSPELRKQVALLATTLSDALRAGLDERSCAR